MSTGNVEVEYIFTHTNHSPGLKETKHIPILVSVHKEIQEKFSQGISVERIMEGMIMHNICVYAIINVTDIQEDIGSRQLCQDFEDVATRKHLIKQQDCHNAIRKTWDFTNQRHTNDAVSVDRIVKKLFLVSPSPIIAYKSQGTVKAGLSISSRMKPFQADMFMEFGMLCFVDSTHKTTQYGYKLITLVVADEFRNGMSFIAYY